MTVRQLIERLSAMDQDLPVRSEGCDCDGPVADAVVDEHEGRPSVLLTRSVRHDGRRFNPWE